ncbi:MAG TPA: ribulose-phosphate 3-epimerase [Acidimicrobiales bacterium]|jgi:ribulose-phosphate 3-epimerase|nr:ribulose-phosphate 3-epimerase [Acidimicrobiales bacterium]
MSSPSASANERFSIIPSVLPSDFARLGEELVALEKAGVDRVQFDVMDGVFVPNLTFGPDVIKSVRSWVEVPFEAHLMIVEPDRMLSTWVEAGCELVIVHAEAATHLHRTLASIREMGAKAAVALNPATPIEAVRHVVDLLDLLLVMTVNPGFGGQDYIATMEPKIAEAAALLRNADHYVELEVDGGISAKTVAGAARAGARALIAGSALYKDPEGLEHAVSEIRERARQACPGVE